MKSLDSANIRAFLLLAACVTLYCTLFTLNRQQRLYSNLLATLPEQDALSVGQAFAPIYTARLFLTAASALLFLLGYLELRAGGRYSLGLLVMIFSAALGLFFVCM